MTRIEKTKEQIEQGGEGCVPYGSITEMIALLEQASSAIVDIIEAAENKEGDPSQDVIDIIVGMATHTLLELKQWNEGV